MDQVGDDERPTGEAMPNRSRVESRPTLLKELIRSRHWSYSRFCKEYDKVAKTLDKDLVGTYPSNTTYKRWLNGRIEGVPRSEPCAVLEAMFSGFSVEQLLSISVQATPGSESKLGGFPGSVVIAVPIESASAQTSPVHLVSDIRSADNDPPSIAVIRAMSDSFQIADRKLGGGKLYKKVSQYLRSEIAPCLLDPPSDCSSDEIFSAAASLTEIAGWMAHDGGDNARARGHFAQAYRLAVAGENAALSANVCASMAHLAIQLELPDDADRISTAGLGHVRDVDGAKQLVARLHAMRARAYAMQGSETGCRDALEAAQRSLSVRDDRTQIGWIAGFDEASLASESALCFYALGALTQAEEESRRVIHLRAGDRVRSRALGQLTLANVLVHEGVYDEAARVGLDICGIAPALNSARVHSGLSNLATALAGQGATLEVAAFLEAQADVRQRSTVIRQETRWPV